MTADEMRDTLLRAVDALNDPARREEYFEILYDDDVVLHGYTPEPLAGVAAVRAFYQALFDGFPDCRATMEQLLVERDHLTARFRSRGPTRASSRGSPRTGAASTSAASRPCASGGSGASSAGRRPTS
jgi:hypothetical protein